MNIDPTLYKTRPTDERLPKEERVYDLLGSLSVPFVRIDHDATGAIEDCAEAGNCLGIKICKNLLLCNQQKTKFYLLMMPGSKHFSTKELSHQIGSSRLSFAPPAFMEQFLDITPGSLSVLGLMNDTENNVRLLIDRDVVADAYFGCHPCINTSSLKIATADLLEKILPAVHHEPLFVELTGE